MGVCLSKITTGARRAARHSLGVLVLFALVVSVARHFFLAHDVFVVRHAHADDAGYDGEPRSEQRASLNPLLQVVSPHLGAEGVQVLLPHGADEVAPQFVRVRSPNYLTQVPAPEQREFAPQLGTYTFKVGWQGIPAATLTLTTEQQGLYYRVSAAARTYSGIEVFYKLRYRAEGLISALDFSPVRANFFQSENSKERFTEISFLEDNQVHAVLSGSKRKTEVLQFPPFNQMLEPFSAAFLARSLDWAPGVSRSFDIFVGKTRYLITLECVELSSLRVNGEERPVWVIEPRVLNLTSMKNNDKLRKAQIFVTADSRREVLRISSEVFIGSVAAWLDSFQPAQVFESPTVIAQAPVAKPIIRR
jgi:hypothetical protein